MNCVCECVCACVYVCVFERDREKKKRKRMVEGGRGKRGWREEKEERRKGWRRNGWRKKGGRGGGSTLASVVSPPGAVGTQAVGTRQHLALWLSL